MDSRRAGAAAPQRRLESVTTKPERPAVSECGGHAKGQRDRRSGCGSDLGAADDVGSVIRTATFQQSQNIPK
jgi:hypothetical protein